MFYRCEEETNLAERSQGAKNTITTVTFVQEKGIRRGQLGIINAPLCDVVK